MGFRLTMVIVVSILFVPLIISQENVPYLKIELLDAYITGFQFSNVYRGNGEFAHLEQLEFFYNQIMVTDENP